MTSTDNIRIADLGALGLRIACRKNTIDERAAKGWLGWARQEAPNLSGSGPGPAILDIGAHIGGFTLLAARLAPDRRILAIEPCRASYEMLLRNVELNGLHNVETAHLAISDRNGEIRLHHDPAGNWGHTTAMPLNGGYEEVESQTLADFLGVRKVRGCSLAKLNCEGAEFPILTSTPIDLLRQIEQMVVCYHGDLATASHSLAGLEGRLEEAGFAVERHGSAVRGHLLARRRPGVAGVDIDPDRP